MSGRESSLRERELLPLPSPSVAQQLRWALHVTIHEEPCTCPAKPKSETPSCGRCFCEISMGNRAHL